MGNRDKRDDKAKKPKKVTKQAVGQVQVTDVPPPVEVIRKKKREPSVDED
jgi:hypothetical protein